MDENNEYKSDYFYNLDTGEKYLYPGECICTKSQTCLYHQPKKSDEITEYIFKSEGDLFVEHIKKHLEPGESVICKICGKSIDEITKISKIK